jgi:hypothetical protein
MWLTSAVFVIGPFSLWRTDENPLEAFFILCGAAGPPSLFGVIVVVIQIPVREASTSNTGSPKRPKRHRWGSFFFFQFLTQFLFKSI